jgi:hypothetical protein
MSECGACCSEDAQEKHGCPADDHECTCCIYCEYKCQYVYEFEGGG